MADLNGIDNIISQYSKTAGTTQAKTQTLGKMDFLKMLVAQLKHQDPLNPMSGTDFAAQLAQFSSLEQLYNLNENLKNMGVYQMSQANVQAVNLIGKEVTAANGNTFEATGRPVDISYRLSTDAQFVELRIYDSTGKLVDTLQYSDQKSGVNTVTWYGGSGATGSHSFKVEAKGSDGKAIEADTLITGKVTAVSFKNQAIYLNVGGTEVNFSDVVRIKQA